MGKMFSDVAPIRVLIVEDEFLICEWVAEALGEQGFAVHTVSNARDALRHLASAPVDVLFTDINLPGGMDGAALARRARDMMPELGVVYASARSDAGCARARARIDLRAQAVCAGARRPPPGQHAENRPPPAFRRDRSC